MSASADRHYLAQLGAAGLWRPAKPLSQYSDATVSRYAKAFRQQEAAGLPLSGRVARGHGVTPEHPTRGARPMPQAYQAMRPKRASKYAPTERGQAASQGFTMRGITHFRPGGNAQLTTPEGEMFTRTNAADILRELVAAARRHDRVSLNLFDCSQPPHGAWAELFHNPGHGAGIDALYLLEWWHTSGQSFEAFLVGVINGAYGGNRFSHICLYELFVLSRPTARTAALQRNTLARGRTSQRAQLRQSALFPA